MARVGLDRGECRLPVNDCSDGRRTARAAVDEFVHGADVRADVAIRCVGSDVDDDRDDDVGGDRNDDIDGNGNDNGKRDPIAHRVKRGLGTGIARFAPIPPARRPARLRPAAG